MMMTTTAIPQAFHIMAKPSGSACNLNCDYCFFLKKGNLYPGSDFRMSDEVHESYIRQLLEAHRVPQVTVAWQGGEPTIMGLDFFRRSIELQKKHTKPGSRIDNTFQTYDILLNDEWCRFFHENNFLVGLSVDGPKTLHDTFGRIKGAAGPLSGWCGLPACSRDTRWSSSSCARSTLRTLITRHFSNTAIVPGRSWRD